VRILCALLFAVPLGQVLAQQSATNDLPARFFAVDVFVDTKEAPLAAYQLEFTVTNGIAKIVGIEGGEHPAFTEPPFYDPKAIQQERVILAAFSTAAPSQLPKGKTRVATIHLQATGSTELKFEAKLQAAAGSNGKRIEAAINTEEKRAK